MKNNINMNKDVYISMEKLIGEITAYHTRKNFIDNMVRVYEEYKYTNFYTKGIIYNSVDRELSKNVIESVMNRKSELVEENNTSAEVLIRDEYLTTIRFHLTDNQLCIDVIVRGILAPKVNKKAMEILAAFLYEHLAK